MIELVRHHCRHHWSLHFSWFFEMVISIQMENIGLGRPNDGNLLSAIEIEKWWPIFFPFTSIFFFSSHFPVKWILSHAHTRTDTHTHTLITRCLSIPYCLMVYEFCTLFLCMVLKFYGPKLNCSFLVAVFCRHTFYIPFILHTMAICNHIKAWN